MPEEAGVVEIEEVVLKHYRKMSETRQVLADSQRLSPLNQREVPKSYWGNGKRKRAIEHLWEEVDIRVRRRVDKGAKPNKSSVTSGSSHSLTYDLHGGRSY